MITRKRISMSFSVLGIVLMGVDLMMTRNFFVHVGELMIASLTCLALGIFIDREKKEVPSEGKVLSAVKRAYARATGSTNR